MSEWSYIEPSEASVELRRIMDEVQGRVRDAFAVKLPEPRPMGAFDEMLLIAKFQQQLNRKRAETQAQSSTSPPSIPTEKE